MALEFSSSSTVTALPALPPMPIGVAGELPNASLVTVETPVPLRKIVCVVELAPL